MRQMSDLSLLEWNRLKAQAMPPAEAVAYLYAGLPCRTFTQTLARLYPAGDLRQRLNAILTQSGTAPESADRTVRNWLAGKSAPDDRETLYRVAFGLHLSVEDTNRLLCAVSDYGIHARDPVEVVYLFALSQGQTYPQAQALRKACAAVRGHGTPLPAATQLLGGQVAALPTDDAFMRWYAANADAFSQLHNAAYGYFMEYLNALMDGGEDFSLEYICNTCLRFQNTVPLERSLRGYDGLQRLLKHAWPSATAIKQMKNRHIDVSRKALLLLYIVSEGETDMDRYSVLDEAYHTPAERLASHATTVDAMLADCGMGALDPRGPFDWLVMYCMCHDVDDGMSERMERVMACFLDAETGSTAG